MINVFKNKDTITKYVLIGLKAIVFGFAITVVLSLIFGCKYLKIVSESMTPKYAIGDVVVVNTKVNYDDLKIGDVITYKSGTTNVTHRIVDKTASGLVVTQGDANNSPDYSGAGIPRSNLVGKVMFGIPKLGTLLESVAKPSNYMILVIALILILFITIM